jgi:hypothetical protein
MRIKKEKASGWCFLLFFNFFRAVFMKSDGRYSMILNRLTPNPMVFLGMLALCFTLQSFAEDALLPGDGGAMPTVSKIQQPAKKKVVAEPSQKRAKNISVSTAEVTAKKRTNKTKAQPTKRPLRSKKAINPALKKQSASTQGLKSRQKVKSAPALKVKKNQPKAVPTQKKNLKKKPSAQKPKDLKPKNSKPKNTKPKASQTKKGVSIAKLQKKAKISPKSAPSAKPKKRPT